MLLQLEIPCMCLYRWTEYGIIDNSPGMSSNQHSDIGSLWHGNKPWISHTSCYPHWTLIIKPSCKKCVIIIAVLQELPDKRFFPPEHDTLLCVAQHVFLIWWENMTSLQYIDNLPKYESLHTPIIENSVVL